MKQNFLIIGSSGSGKTTFLKQFTGVDCSYIFGLNRDVNIKGEYLIIDETSILMSRLGKKKLKKLLKNNNWVITSQDDYIKDWLLKKGFDFRVLRFEECKLLKLEDDIKHYLSASAKTFGLKLEDMYLTDK